MSSSQTLKNLQTLFSILWVKGLFILIFLLSGFSAAYSQDAQSEREITEAIENALTGNYKQAIPVLKKYAEVQEFDDLTKLKIGVYLNWCYLATNKDQINNTNLKEITKNYLIKNDFYMSEKVEDIEEAAVLFYLLIKINESIGDYENVIIHSLNFKKVYEYNEFDKDETFLKVLNSLALGYLYTGQFQLALEINVLLVELGKELIGQEDPSYLIILNNLALSYSELGELNKALEINQKVVELGKEIHGEKDQYYLTSLSNLAMNYSELGNYQKGLEISKKVLEIRKDVLGEMHPDYLISLNNLAYTYDLLGEFKSAQQIYKKVIEVGKEILGENHPNYLTSLSNQALNYSNLGEYELALEVNLIVAELRKNILGDKHPDYLTSLNNIAASYANLGDYQSAIDVNLKVIELLKEALGEYHPNYLTSMNNLASFYSSNGDFHNALKIRLEMVELRKKILGDKHPDYLIGLNNLSVDYFNLGDYKKSLEIDLFFVESIEPILGEKHPDYLRGLNNLANSYSSLGDFQSALKLNLKVVEIRREVLGDMHPDLFSSLSNLASNYSELGDYYNALLIEQKVLNWRKEILGDRHPDYLLSLSNLAMTYYDLGDYQSALRINEQVANLEKEVLGEGHPSYLTTLSNLASCYSSLDEHSTAISINQKVAELRKVTLGGNHPDYLTSLGNLASNFFHSGDYQKSLDFEKKIIKLKFEALGNTHPDYFLSINNLASSYFSLGNYDSALFYQNQVVDLRKQISSENQPEYIESIMTLALTEFKLGEIDQALKNFDQGLIFFKRRAINFFTHLTEYQREKFWEKEKISFQIFPLFLEKENSSNQEELKHAYEIALFTKGLLLNTSLDFEKLISDSGSDEAIAKFQELKILKLQIQELYERPITERYLNVDSLETVAQKLETELVNLSNEYGDYTQNLKITWKDVQNNLGENDVAIEFLEYPTLTDTVKYAALVLRKGWENPKFVPLFRKDQIDEFIKRDPNQIYSNGFIGKEIRKLVWSPLEEFISPGDRVYFSAAGMLHQLAVENFSYDDSTTLGDRYQMHRLSSTKELAMQKSESKSQSVAVYGGIKYDLELDQMIAGSKKYELKNSFLAVRGIDQDTIARKGWQFLPGTLAEANEVSQILNKNRYQIAEYIGETGSEESFKDLSGKKTGIIHIATHGFFLPVEQSKRNPFIQIRYDGQNDNAGYVDPMLRSGLLLAGGNRAWQGDSIPDTIEDGVLTAKEISHLDLRETDLVVLSACETGLGDVSSEGVFGLQRAFKQAGAQTIIMSLWNVKDEATQYLMTNFYSYLMQGASKREAFIQTRNKCRAQYPDPASWAAFIMLD